MTTPITEAAAQQLWLEDYHEYLRVHHPKKYARHLRQQQEAQASERAHVALQQLLNG